MIRVLLPTHLWRLAKVNREVQLEVAGVPTIGSVLDALEAQYPVLRGTMRDQATKQRRPFIRYFADAQDWSLSAPETELPAAVTAGTEPFRIVGAIAGG